MSDYLPVIQRQLNTTTGLDRFQWLIIQALLEGAQAAGGTLPCSGRQAGAAHPWPLPPVSRSSGSSGSPSPAACAQSTQKG